MPDTSLTAYLQSIRTTSSGAATEFSYRPALEALVREFAMHLNRPIHSLTLEPGHITAAGAPDAVVLGPGADDLIGYIETKDLGANLDNLTGHDLRQYQRYSAAFHAWIYTNYTDFRLIENGQVVDAVSLCAHPMVRGTTPLAPVAAQHAEGLGALLDRFLRQSVPVIMGASELAYALAHKARLLNDAMLALLSAAEPNDLLNAQMDVYRRWLIPDLGHGAFADFYAQTLTYGMFLAACESRHATNVPFNRANLLSLLPQNIGPVRAMFQLLSAQMTPPELNWVVDDLIRLLQRADLATVADEIGDSRELSVHFYETFLEQYDPDERELRGVYYTPDEVVEFIVNSVDSLLRTHFARPDGLASPNVTLLDPAVGTGTFLAHALQKVATDLGTEQAGAVANHLRQHALPNWYGFELLASPYVLAHLKLGQVLTRMGVQDAYPRIVLTNTLADHDLPATLPGPFEQAISDDGRAAQGIKRNERVLVILGNPPYRGSSSNEYAKVADYRCPDERARNWLQNDYVKFIRWAEWKLTEAGDGCYGYGIVGYITANSYLRAPLFRCMRQHLFERFDRIYILNLHGGSQYGEVAPEAVQDENVFDIQQGVAIAVFVKHAEPDGPCQVYYADLWGDRQAKSAYLAANSVDSVEWQQLAVEPDDYYFVPRELPASTALYNSWPRLTEVFTLWSQAVITARDKLVYAFTEQELSERLLAFSQDHGTPGEIKERFGAADTRHFRVAAAQAELAAQMDPGTATEVAFRPFDKRWLYYSDTMVEWPRRNVMRHLLQGDNFALSFFRHTRVATPMRAFITRCATDARLLSSESNCNTIPLYRLQDTHVAGGQVEADMGDQTTFGPALLPRLSQQYGREVAPEEVFFYIYGVLNAEAYQDEFQVLLQDGYPRVPFPLGSAPFEQMSAAGVRIGQLHLLEADDLVGVEALTVGFTEQGDCIVQPGYPQYVAELQRVYANESQWFSGVPEEVWGYRVGRYYPLEKWLERRRGRALTADEIRHFEVVGTALAKVLAELPHLNVLWNSVLQSGTFNPLAQ